MSDVKTDINIDVAAQDAGASRLLRMSFPVAILGLAVLALLASALQIPSLLQLVLVGTGSFLTVIAGYFAALTLRQNWRRKAVVETLDGVIAAQETPAYIADETGIILRRNTAARAREDRRNIPDMRAAFADLYAHPEAALGALMRRTRGQGSAHEDIVTRRGHLRLEVCQVSDFAYLWSLTTLAERAGADRATNAISLPMLTAGPTGTILFMNDAFRRMTGGRAQTLSEVFPNLPIVSGSRHEVDGANGTVECLVAQVPSTGGRDEIYLIPAVGDAPRETTQLASWETIEDLPVPLLKLSVTGDVIASNREARALLPMPIGDGTKLSDLLEGLGRPMIDWLSDAAAGRAAPGPQFLRGTGVHQDTFVQVGLNLTNEADEPEFIAVLNDATEFKSLEMQFVQSQKMQAIGQLAGGVAHDFNNLLTAISGHCDLLLLRHDQGDTDYADLIQIHQNANRAASLVGQLLAFSRKQNLKLEVIDLRDTLADLTHLLNRLVGEKVTLTLNHDPLLRHIRADKRQLEQVLMNLVVNARDAMPAGGEIRVDTENVVLNDPLERDRAKLPAGEYSVLHVIDEGTGIPPEKLTKIFEPFWTTKRPGEGTGLGLSTAYGIIKQTGGYIFVDSDPGTGSTFSLYFPSHEKPIVEDVKPAVVKETLPSFTADGVVLLVEDEAPVRAFASRALRMRGYSVLEADSAEAALDMLSDPDLLVDIFVTDVIMPGKDGPTWVRTALEERPDTKVVFVSGYAEDSFSEHQALIPNSVFLPKPFSLTELTSTVQSPAKLAELNPKSVPTRGSVYRGWRGDSRDDHGQ